MKKIAAYQNGNTFVSILKDGTKIREYEGVPYIVHPESIDVKITDYCDMGCSYCHESSTRLGVHGDLNELLVKIKELPAGVELAIGGGNPLSHPGILSFLTSLKEAGIIANITVNQGHLKQFSGFMNYLIDFCLVKGIGISMTSNNYKYILPLLEKTSNLVYHVIAGVNDVSIIDRLISTDNSCKILVLGYKQFGFGVDYYSEDVAASLKKWKEELPNYLRSCTLSFDNLAIEQLSVKRLFTHEGWAKFYMGDDFTYTMYIDAVKQEFAPTSRSRERVSFKEFSLLGYFQKHKN